MSGNPRSPAILAVLAFFAVFLSACTGNGYSGYNGKGWIDAQPRQAQAAPSELIMPGAESFTGEPSAADRTGRQSPLATADTPPARYEQTGFEAIYDGQTNGPQSESGPATHYDWNAEPHMRPGSPHMSPQAATSPPAKVAILLPLSGEKEALGKAMLNAAQMALFDVGNDDFELIPRDTKGTPAGARQAAEEAAQDGAQLILGPLFASSVRAVEPVADRYGLNVITFSTDWTLADDNTYVMGILPFAQVHRIANYAARNGVRRVGIIAPHTAYGNVVTDTFSDAAARNGIEIVNTVKFNPLQHDLSPVVRTFADYDRRVEQLNAHIGQAKARLAANPQDEAAVRQLAELEKMSSFGDVPFDAVFMPVGGEQARALSNLLSFYDLGPGKVQRLGTGLWDDPGLATEPHMKHAWFAAPSTAMRDRFENRFIQLYGLRPPRLSSLAYDATALAAVIARSGQQQYGRPAFDRTNITNPNGYSGIDGIFRFRPDGLIERGLSVLEYRDSTIREIERAPGTFETVAARM